MQLDPSSRVTAGQRGFQGGRGRRPGRRPGDRLPSPLAAADDLCALDAERLPRWMTTLLAVLFVALNERGGGARRARVVPLGLS